MVKTSVKASFPSKKSLRIEVLNAIQGLTKSEQFKKSRRLAQNRALQTEILKSHSLAAYWPLKGEMDPRPLLNLALKYKKNCYLPVLHPLSHNQLLFMKYTLDTPLKINQYGIYEPKINTQHLIPAWMLDLVLVPLLAFDKQGARLGRGKGYYDRTFDFINTQRKPCYPRLIGLAYDLQCYERLPTHHNDVGLSAVVTESHFLHFTAE